MCYNMITALEVDYENPWIYEGRPFTSDDIGDNYGFVYRITNTTSGKQYIGRKYFTQKRKPKGGKRKLPQSQTGSDIMEALTILNEILEKLEKTLSEEKSSPSIQPLEK